jgi:HEAT repeat protein
VILLAAIAVALGAIWFSLGAWLLGERSSHDRARRRADRDADALSSGTVNPRALSRRRLRRVALGPLRGAAGVAAAELVRRNRARLLVSAWGGRSSARMRANAVLIRGGDPVAGELLRALIDSCDPVGATSLLPYAGELPAAESDQLLLELLVAGRLSRSRTATELAPRTGRLRGELVELTAAEDAELRFWAVTLLTRQMRHSEVVEAVRARVADDSPSVRAAVADAFGHARSGSASALLRALLADEVFYVRSHAARAVAGSHDESLADDLLPLLADRNWWVRAAAKESLGMLGDRGLDVAVAALSHVDPFARDGALEILAGARRLVDLGGQAATELATSPALPAAEIA